jgi:hypothetical protein
MVLIDEGRALKTLIPEYRTPFLAILSQINPVHASPPPNSFTTISKI